MKTQINLTIPDQWLEKLKRLARDESSASGKDVTYSDLIRNTISKAYDLNDTTSIMLDACKEDFLHFCNYVQLDHPASGKIQFKPTEMQRRYISFLNENPRVIATKFRQGGFSLTTLSYLAHKAMFQENKRILVVTRTQSDALSLRHRVDRVFRSLPLALTPKLSKDTACYKEFYDTNSSLWFLSSLQACGKDCNILFVDEAAFLRNQDEFFTDMKPVIEACEQVVLLSTTNGINWFSNTYFDAAKGKNAYRIFKSHYSEHFKDAEEVARIRANLGERSWEQEFEQSFIYNIQD